MRCFARLARCRAAAALLRLLACLCLLAPTLNATAASYTASASAATAAAWPWIDISNGTQIDMRDDEVSAALSLGFSFDFGSTSYTSVRIMSNGQLQFAGTSAMPYASALPLDGTNGEPNIDAVLIALWDDLEPGKRVRWQARGTAPNRVFVVSWLAAPMFYNSSLLATFQIQIHEQGQIVFRYQSVPGNGNTALIGLEVSNTDFVQYSFNTASVPANTTIVWSRVPPTPLVAYLFNERVWNGSAGEVRDSGPYGLHGSAAGLAGRASTSAVSPAIPGPLGTCGYGVFERSDKDHVATPASLPDANNTTFTVTGWIRSTNPSLPGQRVMADDANRTGWLVSLGDGGTGRLRFQARGAALTLDTANVIAANTWYFIAVAVDATAKTVAMHVYSAAGATLASVSGSYTSAGIGADAGVASIGGNLNTALDNSSSFGFSGFIDELRVFQRKLLPADYHALRQQGSTCPALLVGSWAFSETGYSGSSGELKDSAGYGGGPFHGVAQGSSLPGVAGTSPARSGSPGTCGYATLAGPRNGGASFSLANLPLATAAGAQTTVAFWMFWDGTNAVIPVSFDTYDLLLDSGWFGFNTTSGDAHGIASTGLANGWRHVVAVFTNGSMAGNQLWINGVQQSLAQRMGTPNLGVAVASSTLRVGAYGAGSSYRFSGRIDELRVYNGAVTPAQVAALYAETATCPSTGPNHLRIEHASGTGLTCAPSTLTVRACQDASCSTPYTAGVAGTLGSTGGSVVWPAGAGFSIAAGSSSTTLAMQSTTSTPTLLGVAGSTPAATGAAQCNFGSPSCTFTAASAALQFDVANHVAETSVTVNVSAVGSSGGSCTSTFASTSRNINFRCSYVNPAAGTLPVRLAGNALNAANNAAGACDGSGRTLSLAFNASGVASTTLLYADVGQLQLSASYTGSVATGDAGLAMTGSDLFIAAPASFGFSAVSAGPIRAGNPFSATVSARNQAGGSTPNFGRETAAEGVTLGFTRFQPTGAGAVDGSFSGSLGAFSGGSASGSDLAWSEVGRIDLNASLASGSYLGSGLSASGSTGSAGAVGRFIAHHFDLTASAACGSFSHAGQPFAMTVTARNAANQVTRNYDGSAATTPSHAQATTLADLPALGLGSLAGHSIAASAFTAGVASASPVYSFSSKTTAPQSLVLRATDADGASSAGHGEPAMALRSGRLRLANAYGSAAAPLQLPVVSEYWAGSSWLLNSADNCSALAGASVVLSNPRNAAGGASTATSSAGALAIVNGSGLLTLAAPSPAGSSLALDVALNLGSSATDQSCHPNHPASTGAALPWLRAQNGSCAGSADRDPAARASFGVFAPETRRTVHVREIF